MKHQPKAEGNDIPAYELFHKGREENFAIRTTKDVMQMYGDHYDIPHSHNYYTVLWSHNESGRHIIDYKEYTMKTNDVFFVSPGQVHQVWHTAGAQETVILFTCNFLTANGLSSGFISNMKLFSDLYNTPPISLPSRSVSEMTWWIEKMKEEFESVDDFRFGKIGAYLKLFLIECNKYAQSQSFTGNTQILQVGGILVQKFKQLLELKFKEWHKVSDYAAELNVSSDYLNTAIKTTEGRNAKELIQQRIILEAKRMGIHTDMSTKEIAYSVGFSDPSHFSRFFKNTEGDSFGSFRTTLNKELTSNTGY